MILLYATNNSSTEDQLVIKHQQVEFVKALNVSIDMIKLHHGDMVLYCVSVVHSS